MNRYSPDVMDYRMGKSNKVIDIIWLRDLLPAYITMGPYANCKRISMLAAAVVQVHIIPS